MKLKRKKKIKDDNIDNIDNISDDEYNVFKVVKSRLDKIIKSDEQIDISKFNYKKLDIIDIINDTVYKINNIVYHTHNFLKLYILHLYHNREQFPTLNRNFIMSIMMNIVSKKKDLRGSKTSEETNNIINNLKKFYNEHYKDLINEKDLVYCDYLSFSLTYEADNILTCIKNNITEHYLGHIKKYIRILFNYRRKLEDKEEDKKIRHTIYNFYLDVINIKNNTYLSDEIYHDIINKIKRKFIPINKKFTKESLHYDLKTKPLEYLKYFIHINNHLELYNIKKNIKEQNNLVKQDELLLVDSILEQYEKLENNEINIKKVINISNYYYKNNIPDIKLFNILPLKKSLIPSHITLDTASIVSILFKKDKLKYLKDILKYKKFIWENFFKTDTKIFRKNNNFEFTGSIKTDGFSVSIVFGYYDKNINKYKKKEEDKEDYIEDHTNIKEIFNNKNYVVIDPNKEDLLYCLDNNGNKFRYSNSQRKYETESKRFNKYFENLKKNTEVDNNENTQEIYDYLLNNKDISISNYNNNLLKQIKNIIVSYYTNTKYNNRDLSIKHIKSLLVSKKDKKDIINDIIDYIKSLVSNITEIKKIKNNIKKYNNRIRTLNNIVSIKTIESLLSEHNSKTNNVDKFKEYIKTKEKVNRIITFFYRENRHRKRKLNIYSNTRRSEDKMIKNFRDKFGNSDDTIVVMGDFSERNNYMKNKEPTINITLRKLLRKASYKVYMIDEYKTSKLCNKCECELKRNYKRINESNTVWGLVCCTNKTCVQELNSKNNTLYKKRYINRDTNSVLNMQKIIKTLIETDTRPTNYINPNRCV